MLPGMGGFEAVIIALLALVIVGPKDLPILMRKLALWVNKLRGMAAEFRMSFDELARQSELDELRREVEALRRGDPLHPIRSDLDPVMQDINAGLNGHDTTPAPDLDPYLPTFDPALVTPGAPPAAEVAPPVEAKPARKPRARRKIEAAPAVGPEA